MAYTFSAVFSDGDAHVLAALSTEISGSHRLIEQPFRGFGIELAEPSEQQFADTFPLVAWSKKFPNATFVYVYVECFGGDCDRAGFAFRNGEILQNFEIAENDVPLRELLRHLGVEFGNRTYFAPLQRGYFESEIKSS